MPVDKWGIPFFYPTRKTAGITNSGTGFYWTQDNDVHKDDDYEGDAFLRIGKEHDSADFKVISTTTGEWQFPFTYDYDYEPSMSLSGPTGHHSGGETHGCQGFTYMINGDWNTTPPQFRFRKETYHVQYDDHPEGKWTSPFATGAVANNWKGFGWVRYNKKDGRGPGKDSVICEAWWNEDPVADIKNWKMLKRIEDKGAGITNWGVPATCDGEAYQVGTWSNIQFRFKSSGSDFSLHPLIPEPDSGSNVHSIGGENMSFSDSEARGYGKQADMPRDIEMKCLFKWNGGGSNGLCRFKNVSIREIDPTLSFDDTPNTPPPGEEPTDTQTISGNFTFKWDLNTVRTSACAGTGGGGGSGGTTKFYSVTPDAESSSLGVTTYYYNTTSIGEYLDNSSSIINGKTIKQADVWLKKTGTPGATPTIKFQIYNSSGTLQYTSTTEIDPTTLTTSFAKYTFNCSTNTYAMTSNSSVAIYNGGNTSSSNYINVGYDSTADTIANSRMYNYEGSWPPYFWASRDLAMDLWE